MKFSFFWKRFLSNVIDLYFHFLTICPLPLHIYGCEWLSLVLFNAYVLVAFPLSNVLIEHKRIDSHGHNKVILLSFFSMKSQVLDEAGFGGICVSSWPMPEECLWSGCRVCHPQPSPRKIHLSSFNPSSNATTANWKLDLYCMFGGRYILPYHLLLYIVIVLHGLDSSS
jgi:hypothetical protein